MNASRRTGARVVFSVACGAAAVVAWRAGVGWPLLSSGWLGDGPTALLWCCLGTAAGVLVGGLLWMTWFEDRDAVLRLGASLDLQPGDVTRAPLAEVGPRAIARLIRSINARAARDAECTAAQLQAHAQCVHEMRSRLVRVGLHCEQVRDAVLRARMERDLLELDALIHASLAAARAGQARSGAPGSHEAVVDAMPSLPCAA